MTNNNQKSEIAYFMRRLYQQGLTTTSGGNISFRTEDKLMLITPSALDKARLETEQIAVIDLEGENLTPHLKPSIETGMHLAIYNLLPEVKAIVHAHPAISSAFTAMNTEINCKLMAESRAILGEPAFAPYALMGTEKLAEIVAKKATESSVVLMENHGILATGKSLLEAFDKIEVLEAAAKITMITTLLKDKNELTSGQIKDIDILVN